MARKSWFARCWLFASALAAAGCGRTEPAPADLPGGGRIAFVFDRNVRVDRDILVVDALGREPWALTSGGGTNEAPAWSPEGRMILFSRNVDGLKAIFSWEDEGQIERVCSAPFVDMAPSWAPDGLRFAVMSLRDGHWQLYTIRADGTADEQLLESDANDQWPAWSPDGKRIAFVSDREGFPDLWVTDAEGKEPPVRLTEDRFVDRRPAWSPDGRRIAWSSDRDGQAAIFVMDADGKNARRLTSAEHASLDPAWSPDGRALVFVGTHEGYQELYLIGEDGKDLRRLTELRGTVHTPAWGRRRG